MAKGNRPGHRRFGNVRRLPSGRYQVSYLGPDGQRRNAPDTFERKSDAERALVMIEAQLSTGQWTDPERGKVKLAEYAATWIAQRPGLRPRSADNYRWLLKKHITPRLGGVPVGKLSTPMIREWRAALLDQGVSVSTAAKAYRLLRAVLMTAVDEDKILPSNPCRKPVQPQPEGGRGGDDDGDLGGGLAAARRVRPDPGQRPGRPRPRRTGPRRTGSPPAASPAPPGSTASPARAGEGPGSSRRYGAGARPRTGRCGRA